MINKFKDEKQFTDRQLQAIELLARKEVEKYTIEYIGEQVGVTRKTIHTWLQDEDFKKAVNDKALMCLADYSPMVLKTANDFLYSKDEKIKARGVDLVMKSVEAQEKAQEEAKRREAEKVDVDAFLKQLGIPDTDEEMLAYCEGRVVYYQNEIKRLKEKLEK